MCGAVPPCGGVPGAWTCGVTPGRGGAGRSVGARSGCCFGTDSDATRGFVGTPTDALSVCTRWAVACWNTFVCWRTWVRVVGSSATVRMPFSFDTLAIVVTTSVFWTFLMLVLRMLV